MKRCEWCTGNSLYESYHDNEWGVPLYDDYKLFESLTLESFQSGLSWITILKKRENFRKAFDSFDYQKIAVYNKNDVKNLLSNEGIVRHKNKILATIQNAKSFIKIQQEFKTFSEFIWAYVDYKPEKNNYNKTSEIPSKTELSNKISLDLKKYGFKFMGATTTYAFMQAIGIVDDHIKSCFKY